MVRTPVAAARGSRAADRRRRRQRLVRGGRCRARAGRAVRPPVLDPAEPASARHRARRDDDAGNVAAPRADPDESDLPEGGASPPASERCSMGAVGSPGATRPATRAVPAAGEHSRLQRGRIRLLRHVSPVEEPDGRCSAAARRSRRPLAAVGERAGSRTCRRRRSSPRRHRSDVRLQHEHPRGHLRAEEPRALRSSERLGVVEAPVGWRE